MGFRVATLAGVDGDYNNNGVVDAGDYVLWRKYSGQSVTLPNDTTPGSVMPVDYDVWRAQFGKTPTGSGSGGDLTQTTVPEPATISLMAAMAGVAFLCGASRRSSRFRLLRG